MDKTGQTFKSDANKTAQSNKSKLVSGRVSEKNVTKTSDMPAASAKASSKKDEVDTKRSEQKKRLEEKVEQIASSDAAKKAELEKMEAEKAAIRAKYTSIIDSNPNKYQPKMVGLNPNMHPRHAKASHSKIFPMQGLWSDKKLLKSTNQEMGVSETEQVNLAKELPKQHYKKMYEQKEYMEEWLKFKEVIAGMKK